MQVRQCDYLTSHSYSCWQHMSQLFCAWRHAAANVEQKDTEGPVTKTRWIVDGLFEWKHRWLLIVADSLPYSSCSPIRSKAFSFNVRISSSPLGGRFHSHQTRVAMLWCSLAGRATVSTTGSVWGYGELVMLGDVWGTLESGFQKQITWIIWSRYCHVWHSFLLIEARIVHANIDELQTWFGEPALGKSQLRPEDCSIFCHKA